MKHTLTICALVTSLTVPAWATDLAGTLVDSSFASAALGGEEKPFQIYLPPGYENSGEFYPVVYFLHGGTERWYSQYLLVAVVDELISEGLIEPILLVKPCGRPSAPQMGRWIDFPDSYAPGYIDSELMGAYESYPVVDLVAHVDTSYRSIADRDHRSVCGKSFGGMGAMRYALRHPDVFGRVATGASVLDWQGWEWVCQSAAEEQGFRPIEEYEPSLGNMAAYMLSFAGHFLPNLDNPPWYLDYPCRQGGDAKTEEWERMDAESACAVAEGLSVRDLDLTIAFFAASNDPFGAAADVHRFANILDPQKAAHTKRIYPSSAGDPHADYRPEMMVTFLHPMRATAWARPTRLWSSVPLERVSVRLVLPEALDANDVQLNSIVISAIDGEQLYEPIGATAEIQAGVVEAEFDWTELMDALEQAGADDGSSVELTIRGEMSDSRFFAGTDTVRCDTSSMVQPTTESE